MPHSFRSADPNMVAETDLVAFLLAAEENDKLRVLTEEIRIPCSMQTCSCETPVNVAAY